MLLVKYPTRSRPILFQQQVCRYLADPLARMLVTIDADDPTMANDTMFAWMAHHPRLKVRVGNSTSKVAACNDGLVEEDWQYVCLASDDMIPTRDDYAARILFLFQAHFPDGDGVLHLNDGRAGKILNTICCCDRKYFNRTNYLYRDASKHDGDGYVSLYCDDEWQQVSERAGRAVYIEDVIVQHNWIGESAPDALHRFNESFSDQDGRTFQRRKLAGFPT